MAFIEKLDERLTIIDSLDLGMRGRTSTYVLQDEKIALFEPSASPSIPHILEGLKELSIPLEKIDFIIVTHIHLDHAGGAGLLLEKCPNAYLVVHPKGAKHLIDPSRLIAGAQAVYGSEFNRLFDPIIPIPENRLLIMENADTLKLSDTCTLTFYDSPGHANHHFSIHDSVSNGIFTGDAIGIFYQELLEDGLEFYLPSTSPNQFNPEAMLKSAQMIEKLAVEKIYYSHFGVSSNPNQALSALRKWLPVFLDAAERGLLLENDKENVTALAHSVQNELQKSVFKALDQQNISKTHSVYDILKLDLSVCAMGLVDYLEKRKRLKQPKA
ncbi:MBL fold metallo-hydrolase [Metabacillus herbersteinensis]|uniref:MBL fold metallo-hydrolase n=1 Tax=Metabacillus herbersteinensis TaxID=283816 RepID=A0ABV6GAL5_9BACI